MYNETDVIELLKTFFASPSQYDEPICDEILKLAADHFLFTYVETSSGNITVIHGVRQANIQVECPVGVFRNLCARFAVRYERGATEKPTHPPLYGFKGNFFFEPTATYFDLEVKNVLAEICSIEIRSTRNF